MIVFPFSASFFMQSIIDIAINESRPLVGSSQNNRLGSVINLNKKSLESLSVNIKKN